MNGIQIFANKQRLALGLASAVTLGLSCGANAEAEKLRLDIKNQVIGPALMELGEKAGVQIVFPQDIGTSITTAGINGDYTLSAALDTILQNSGLVYEFVTDDSILIKRVTAEGSDKGEKLKGDQLEIEEMIVTATRREENLQDVPMSINAISGKDLEERGLMSINDIITMTPGVDAVIAEPGRTIIVMRGVATNNFGAGHATTATYLNDFAFAGGRTVDVRFIDMNRVEALKGPQGTLFGKSAMGGIVRYITNRPNVESFSGGVATNFSQTQRGGFNHDQNFYVNIPVNDQFALRAVGYSFNNDGFIDGTFRSTENNINTEDTRGGRLAARWHIDDSTTLDLTYLQQKIETGSIQAATASFSPFPRGTEPTDLEPINISDPKNAFPYATNTSDKVLGIEFNKEFESFTMLLLGSTMDAEIDIPPYELGLGLIGNSELDDETFTGEVLTTHDDKSFELRLVSNTDEGDRFQWMTGLWYEKGKKSIDINYLYNGPGAVLFGFLPVTGSTLLQTRENNGEKAVYGEVGYQFNDQWKLIVGGRYSNLYNESDVVTSEGDLAILQPLSDNPVVKNNGIKTYRLVLEYQLTGNHLLYASATSGYRRGGYNAANPLADLPQSIYGSDELWNYELGARTMWFDDHLTANAAIYRVDWTDVQMGRLEMGPNGGGFAFPTRNYGGIIIDGLELDLRYSMDNGLNFGMNYSYIDGIVEDVFDGSVKGERLPGSAKNTYAVFVDYATSLTPTLDMAASLTHRYTGDRLDEFLSGVAGWTGVSLDSYTTTDARVRFMLDNGLEATLFADNVFDEKAVTFFANVNPGQNTIPEQKFINRPRTVGVGISYKF